MRALFTFIALTMITASVVISGQRALPKGYRYPTEADRSYDWDEFKKEVPTPFHARADFDGDGRDDDAWILLASDGSGWGLFVFLGTSTGTPSVLALESNAGDVPAQTMGVAVAPKGAHPTACGKGYWPCEKGEPETLHLKRPGIDFFKFESASSIFWWDVESKGFKRTWMSD